MIHTLVGIIHHHRQLIGKVAIGALQDEVADLTLKVLADPPLDGVVETHGAGVDPQPPGPRGLACGHAMATGARIDARAVRRQRRIGQLAAGTATAINPPGSF